MMYNHYADKIQNNFKYSFDFMKKRLKKFINIHIITFCLMIPYVVYNFIRSYSGIKSIIKLTLTAGLNFSLLQSWIPKPSVYFSFNTVSWYLSTILFCYICTPKLIKFIRENINTNKRQIIVATLLIIVKIFFEYVIKNISYYDYICHVNPIYRLGDYFLGLILGAYFLQNVAKYKKKTVNIMQIVTILIYIISVFVCRDIWVRALYIPLTMIMIYFIAIQEGIIAKCITNKITEKLGKINLEFFMTHMILISYIPDFIWYKFVPNTIGFNILLVITLFILSICFSFLLKYINNVIDKFLKKER